MMRSSSSAPSARMPRRCTPGTSGTSRESRGPRWLSGSASRASSLDVEGPCSPSGFLAFVLSISIAISHTSEEQPYFYRTYANSRVCAWHGLLPTSAPAVPRTPQLSRSSNFVDRGWGRAFQTIEASGRSAGVVATRSGVQRHDGGWALPAGLVAFVLSR